MFCVQTQAADRRKDCRERVLFWPVSARGRFRDTTIALGVSDKQVAEAKLRRIVQELEREGEGLIPSRKLRDGLQMPFSGLVEEYVAEIEPAGAEREICQGCSQAIGNARGGRAAWRTVKDVSADSFLKWRQRQNPDRQDAQRIPDLRFGADELGGTIRARCQQSSPSRYADRDQR